jgi:sec-independent protein translocase protein TatA
MFGLGMPELMVVLVVVMVFFGGKRLPELATGMGKAIRNFKKASTEPDEINVTLKKTITEDIASETKEKGAGA